MTLLLYQTDSYLREFSARIEEVQETGVILDRTAFYPGGGGQPADGGDLIDESGAVFPLKGMQRKEGKLIHLVDAPASLSPGNNITGRVDWERRYLLMRTHTAMHILCGVIWRDYRAQVTGGNMEPGRGRLDFEFERMDRELVNEIEEKINHEVAVAREVKVRILPREEAFGIPDLIRTKINLLPAGISEVRTVNIVGLDLQADGGTHVANTREVGPLKIVDYKSKGRINKRLVVGLQPAVQR